MPTALVIADASWVVNEVNSALSIGDWVTETINEPANVVDRLEESAVDAAIVDMQIGSMGGMAVIRAIRQGIDAEERPRLILLLDRQVDAFLAGRAGADACVRKPINASDLRTALGMKPPVDEEE